MSLRSAMISRTRLPRSCPGLRCRMVTSCSALSSAATRLRPMKRVPPMTRTFMAFYSEQLTAHG